MKHWWFQNHDVFDNLWVGFIFTGFFGDDLAFAQFSNQNTIKVSFENNVAPSYDVPLIAGQTFTLSQSYSWVQDETSRYNLVSYTLDGDTVKISRDTRRDFTLSISTDSSHNVVFAAVPQYALSVEGTNDFSYLPSSPTRDNWFHGICSNNCGNNCWNYFDSKNGCNC